MSQQARKSIESAASKKVQSSSQVVHSLEQAEKKVIDMSRGSIKKLLHRTDNLAHTAAECMDICSGNLEACIESGSKAPKIFKKISEEMLDGYNRSLSDASKISQDALKCHTMKDIIDLPGKAMVVVLDNYFDQMSKLSALIFDSSHDALEPLRDRACTACKQVRKVLAT